MESLFSKAPSRSTIYSPRFNYITFLRLGITNMEIAPLAFFFPFRNFKGKLYSKINGYKPSPQNMFFTRHRAHLYLLGLIRLKMSIVGADIDVLYQHSQIFRILDMNFCTKSQNNERDRYPFIISRMIPIFIMPSPKFFARTRHY